MQQAQKQLAQGQPHGAQQSMHQAAQQLAQAAQQLAQQQQRGQPMQNTDPGVRGASGDGAVDPSLLGPDNQKYAGKRWGELPGELRTKIIQDMKAKYGDDYARVIKLYFEQIADTKKK
jgi:outer membrane PBP1 activator LpoA protein